MKPERDLYDFLSKNRETGEENKCRPASPPSLIDWLPSSPNGPWRRTLVLYLQVPSHLVASHRIASQLSGTKRKSFFFHLPSTKHGGVEFDVIREDVKKYKMSCTCSYASFP